MSKQRVVIFGGSGFIGTRLARRLLDTGREVRIADVDPGTPLPDLFVEADVRKFDDCVRACRGMDVIYNLAAEHDDDVFPTQRYYDTNVGGARNVCRAAEELGIKRIVFTSTVAVYGLPDHEVDETGEPAPFNDYGKSKLQAEEVYQEWARAQEDRCLVTVRPTVIFGEGNRRNFYVLLSQIASGRFVMVGAGRNRKSIGYVENCAAFLEYVLRCESGEHTFNYVDKPDFDMNTLVPLLRSMLGKNPRSWIRLPYWAAYAFGILCDVVARMMQETADQRHPNKEVLRKDSVQCPQSPGNRFRAAGGDEGRPQTDHSRRVSPRKRRDAGNRWVGACRRGPSGYPSSRVCGLGLNGLA